MKTIAFILLFLLAIATVGNPSPSTEAESGKLLSDWIRLHLQLVRTHTGVAHVAYSRHFAYASVAFYESILPGNKKHRSLAGQLQGLNQLPVYASHQPFSMKASANAAYAFMLRLFYKGNVKTNLIDSLEKSNLTYLMKTGVTTDQIKESGEFGKSIANAIWEWSLTDHADKANDAYTPNEGEQFWKPTPPKFVAAAMPYWKNNRTMIKDSGDKVFNILPPAYSSQPTSGFYKMVEEVYTVSQQLTDEQKNIAWFWDDSPGKYQTVPGHWSSILAQVIDEKKLSVTVAAEAYSKMTISLYDASVAAWRGKYTYNVIRPITYIRLYFNQDWLSLIETPSHPEFPAAHAVLSSSATTALAEVLGNQVAFTDATYAYLAMKPRSFSSFEAAAKEAGLSRLYGGIHYRFSIDEGLAIGKLVAQNVGRGLKFKK